MSRRAVSAICLAVLLLLGCFAVRAAGVLPMSRQALIEEKYAGWTGVLRLWTCEGWQSGSGSLTSWLNGCIASFERAHPGVYVQAQAVEAQALAALGESGINPPDLILFPPGLLASGENLRALEVEAALTPPLAAAGLWEGRVCALPVARGAYAWAYDRAQLPALPDTWTEAEAALALPEDEPWRCWSGAALALCSGLSAAAEAEFSLPGIDLGLAEAAPEPTRAPEAVEAEDGVPCALPADTPRSADAYREFVSGSLAAIPVTQWELRRLELLADAGRGPDWQAAIPGKYALADQLALLAVVDWPRTDAQARQELALAFLAHLLSAECQAALSRARAFPVTAGVSAYEGRGAMAQLESALQAKVLLVPNAFDGRWREAAAQGLAAFLSGRVTAREALEGLRGLSGENPNIPAEAAPE